MVNSAVHSPLRLALTLVLAVALGASAVLAQAGNYIIGSQDVVSVTVFDQADLGGKYTVETDGTFTFPLVGRVKVAGLTLREVEQLLQRELSNGFLKRPQVSVSIEQYRSQRIFVVGEVRTPGTYPLTGEMTLIEALARACSTTGSAGSEVIIVRPSRGTRANGPLLPDAGKNPDDSVEVIHVDVNELQAGRLSQNARLQDDDTIYVPRAEIVYVFGQVKTPGSFPYRKGMTVLQALSLAGGLTDRGATNRIKIIRIENGNKLEVKVRLDDPVRPGDTITVAERFF